MRNLKESNSAIITYTETAGNTINGKMLLTRSQNESVPADKNAENLLDWVVTIDNGATNNTTGTRTASTI